jgi:hypothetical protein
LSNTTRSQMVLSFPVHLASVVPSAFLHRFLIYAESPDKCGYGRLRSDSGEFRLALLVAVLGAVSTRVFGSRFRARDRARDCAKLIVRCDLASIWHNNASICRSAQSRARKRDQKTRPKNARENGP